MTFLEALQSQVIVVDGAMGTMIQALDLTDADFGGKHYRMLSDLLVFSKPDALRDIHLRYFRAGANAVETNTFGASPMRLSEYDFSGLDTSSFVELPDALDLRVIGHREFAYNLNRRAAEIACRAREEFRESAGYNGRPLFVFGSIGPSNYVLSSTPADLRESTFEAVMDNFESQVEGLIDGGVDVLLHETQQDILELKAAVMGSQRAMKKNGVELPIIAQVTANEHSKMQIFNTGIHAALVAVEGIGIDAFGINCSVGPGQMETTLEKLSRFCSLPISVMPNAGLPVSENGKTVFKLGPTEMAEHVRRFVEEFGVNIVGGCCGTTPDHIREIAEAVKGLKPAQRNPDCSLYVSGPQETVLLDRPDADSALVRIGERLNVRGSKKVRLAVERDGDIDHDALEEVVNEQVRDLGTKIIDVCMDSNEVDTINTLKEVIHQHTADFPGAMCIDSFDVEALTEAIKVYPGRPIINSVSMEEVSPGLTKLDAVMSAVEQHCPVYIALATGPKGPAMTADEKIELTRQVVETAREKYGVPADRILMDVNAFPIGSESDDSMNFARETLDAIKKVKKLFPGIKTSLGVGNLTTGLAKKPYMRRVVTSTFLDEASKRGLDAALVNPSHFVFVNDLDAADHKLALSIIFDHDMDAFAELEEIAEQKKGTAKVAKKNYDDFDLETSICEKIKDGYKDREAGSIEIDGIEFEYSDRIVLQVAQALKKHEPLVFINDYLMKAMQELGDGFARGEVSLPRLLKSADVMQQAMRFIESFMKKGAGDGGDAIEHKGTIVLGTVYQDVHSIGKDLAKTLLENYGYRVIDLGVMTPLQSFIDSAKEHNADAIGMSALLVQTSNHMITVSKMMLEQGMKDVHVLVGGAPVNERHAAYVAMAGQDDHSVIRDNVFYCRTAMDGVNVMNTLASDSERDAVLKKNRVKLAECLEAMEKRDSKREELLTSLPRREVSFDNYSPAQGAWFAREKIEIDIKDFASKIDKKALFSLNWRYGGSAKQQRQGTDAAELEELFLKWIESASAGGWVEPKGVYGLYPCQADGDEIVVYNPEDINREIARLHFTFVVGVGKKDVISPAQYFYSVDSGVVDTIGLQIGTGGLNVQRHVKRFEDEGDSVSALFLQGLADRVAEDMAGLIHNSLREKMDAGTNGARWSPGYPVMPDLADNCILVDLLDATGLIGVEITGPGEFKPTGTTGAAVSFHPDAHYS